MGEIALKGQFLESLNSEELVLVNALQQPKLLDLSPAKIEGVSALLILDAIARNGQKNVEPEISAVMASDLEVKMKTEFKAMTIAEIKMAITEGGLASESYGVSSKLVIQWIRSFRNTTKLELSKSIAAKRIKANSEKLNPPEYSEEQKLAAIQNQFEGWIKGKEIAVFIYPFIEHFGYKLKDPEKWEVLCFAADQVHNRVARQEVPALARPNKKQRMELCRKAKKGEGTPAFVAVEAQRITIEDLFQFCKEKEMNPADYFNHFCMD